MPSADVDAAHPRGRGKRDEDRADLGDVAFTEAECGLRQHHDAAPLRRLVGERGELSSVGEISQDDTGRGNKRARLPIAERDRAGLVEKKNVDVAGRFHRAARCREHVRAKHAAHAGHPDRGKQRADGRRDETYEQRHQHGDRDRFAGVRRLHAVEGKRQQRDRGEQEHERQRCKQNFERDLVRRLAPLRAFDHRDHAVEKGLAGIHRAAHDDPIRKHTRAAGHRRKITAGFPDHGSRFTGDRGLVDRRDAFDHFAVAGHEVAGFDQHDVAATKVFGGLRPEPAALVRLFQALRPDILAHPAQRRCLRLAAALRERLCEIGEEHSEPQPHRHRAYEPRGRFGVATQRIDPQPRRKQAADEDDEHDRIACLYARVELAKRIDQRRAQQRPVEQRYLLAAHGYAFNGQRRASGARRSAQAPVPARKSARRRAKRWISAVRRRGACGSAAFRPPPGSFSSRPSNRRSR